MPEGPHRFSLTSFQSIIGYAREGPPNKLSSNNGELSCSASQKSKSRYLLIERLILREIPLLYLVKMKTSCVSFAVYMDMEGETSQALTFPLRNLTSLRYHIIDACRERP